MNTAQLHMNFNPVHIRENNPESQDHLELHRASFTKGCWTTLRRMLAGEVITNKQGINSGISDIRRRSKDLIDGFGIPVQREWELDSAGNKTGFKIYYIKPEDIPSVLMRIVDRLEVEAV